MMATAVPGVNDVLLGRGTCINNHPGNRQFRSMVDAQKENFGKATSKKEKRAVAVVIYGQIQILHPPGRFLAMDRRSNHNGADDYSDDDFISTKTWSVVAPDKALLKIMHRLRESDTKAAKAMKAMLSLSQGPQMISDWKVRAFHSRIRTSIMQPNAKKVADDDDRCPVTENCPNDDSLRKDSDPSIIPEITSFDRPQEVQHASFQVSAASGGGFSLQGPPDSSCLPLKDASFQVSSASGGFSLQSPPESSVQRCINSRTSMNPNDASTAIKGRRLSSNSDLCNYLEGNGLDFELDSLVRGPTPQLDRDASTPRLREYTLQQWIELSLPDFNSSKASSSTMQLSTTSSAMGNYIQSALRIALKLIESIVEADKDEQNGHDNPIPLARITPENVMIGTKRGVQHHGDGESSSDNEAHQIIIEYVWVMSIIGDDSAIGDTMTRLFAAGKVLYYLFSVGIGVVFMAGGEKDPPYVNASMNGMSVNSIHRSNEVAPSVHAEQKKKRHWRSTYPANDEISNYIAKLESMKVPWSLCTLIRNLLECQHGSFCQDETYSSFDDVHLDLQLMVANPSCFLDNIHNIQKVTILNKLYGRDEESMKLNDLYQNHITGKIFSGAIISGGAGAGKSKLGLYLHKLTNRSNGYYLSTKFEQYQMRLKPLSAIANMFDSLCEMLFNESSQSQIAEIEERLISAFGSQTNLLGVMPNLRKLMPSSCLRHEETTASLCVDSAVSMRYLCGELLRVTSSHSKPITIVIDDIQFADPASLLLIGSLLFSAQGAPIFFVLCHRDDEVSVCGPFKIWLNSIDMFSLEPIKLESITTEAVNSLVSEALHVSPRLTRPLSSILHCKTRGNPLFLKQLLDSLTEQGYIYVDLIRHRWAWDLYKILELEISDDVLALLMKDIQRLPSDLQFGLQVASCIGSCVTYTMLGYLSTELELDLKDMLRQVSRKGFMIDIASSTMFRFAHDKIQEAAYELMPEQQRRENHMRFGLLLCTHTMKNNVEDDELFFAAINQINQGGPTAVHEPSQMSIIAQLNLKAGRRSIELSDYITAFKLFRHGISFLGNDHWAFNYRLSLELYDAAAEAAVTNNTISAVALYTDAVVSHASCFDDKLHCKNTPFLDALFRSTLPTLKINGCYVFPGLIISAKAIGAHRPDESIDSAMRILLHFGECLPRSMADASLRCDIDRMNHILLHKTDYMLCNMQENNDKKLAALLNLYVYLAHVLHYFKPWLVGAVSLRMVELTLKVGLSVQSPLVFAHFGGLLVTSGCITEGCRLGKLALKLVEKKGSIQYKSSVICFVYDRIIFISEPFQLIANAHLLGHKCGQQSGDFLYALTNQILAIKSDYAAGHNLDKVQKDTLEFLSVLQGHGLKIFRNFPLFLLSQIMALKEGLHMADVAHVENMPREGQILASAKPGSNVLLYGKIHHLTRAFLFRQMDDASANIDVSGTMTEGSHQLNLFHLMGFLFEGLTAFLLARQKCGNESAKYFERGQSVLSQMRCWSEHSRWNWENKLFLLEAESMFTIGDFDRAGSLYVSAIQSAHEHNFLHENAIASELAGMFFLDRGFQQKSLSCFVYSIKSYRAWGAQSVARRVESFIECNFGYDVSPLVSTAGADTSFEYIFASSLVSQKKRQKEV
ncbi:hypothetical protein ACHAXH_004913 [Discostella pseudostelligera]